MSLDGLLTFISIVVAIYAIPGQTQRRSMYMLVSWQVLIILTLLSATFLLSPGTLSLLGYELLPWSTTLFPILAFVFPVAALIVGIVQWLRARLNNRSDQKFRDFLTSCLRENIYDEAERVLRKNKKRLQTVLKPDTLKLVFDRKFVSRLCQSRSWLHLDLLADEKLLNILPNRFAAVDAVIREMLNADESPLRSAVIHAFGGEEHRDYSTEQKTLIEATLQNPKWYHAVSAHYPILISAMEQLNSGKIDSVYNVYDKNYVAIQGVSNRARCAVWLAIKAHVLAIRTAINQRYNEDFYVSDLMELFHAIRERSVYSQVTWEGERACLDSPTPYAYLLYQITQDFYRLSCAAVKAATNDDKISKPNQIVRQLAPIWAFCALDVARSTKNVSERFKLGLLSEYLEFLLQLGFGQYLIYGLSSQGTISGLDEWRDLYANELKVHFLNADFIAQDVLIKAINRLDTGKQYIFAGKSWLDATLSMGCHE
jgi:hypothetical protein